MTTPDLIAFIERNDVVATPALDERGMRTGWVANCPAFVGWVAGKTWQEAVEKLAEELEK